MAASMSFQGNPVDWLAVHRRHHAFTDRPGDPHSPYRYGAHLGGQLRGLTHAHLGWLFSCEPTSTARYAPGLLRNDPAMLRISRAFPAFCAASLLLPFAAGWAISGSLYGGLTAFIWAGLVRIALLQHVTWTINSLCHMIRRRPHTTRRHDRSTHLWPLAALLSFGESWHHGHHSHPGCARHGRGPLVRTPELGHQRALAPRRRPPTPPHGGRQTHTAHHDAAPRQRLRSGATPPLRTAATTAHASMMVADPDPGPGGKGRFLAERPCSKPRTAGE
jgi:hypothetical protein